MAIDLIGKVIIPFVSHYDIPFKYDEGIGKLWHQGCFRDLEHIENSNVTDLTEFVGAHYCAMIREDVYLRLTEGLQLLRRSQDNWEELNKCLPCKEIDEVQHRYILARWQDAKGRILYRTGNYTLARLAFLKALEIISDDLFPARITKTSPYWCWPDIKSNLERTNFEIARQYGDGDDKQAKSLEARQELELAIEWSRVAIACEFDTTRKKELLRGLVSCLHNWLSCEPPDDTPQKHQFSYQLENLLSSWCNDDIYRNAQFLSMKGQLEKKSSPEKSKEFYRKLSCLPWPRGRFFANQNIANLEDDWETLLQLCEGIAVDIERNGGIDAVDIDRYSWTLQCTERCMPPEEKVTKEVGDRLRKQQAAITRALSGIVSVATYRQKFEKSLRPRLRLLASEMIASWKHESEIDPRNANEKLDQLIDSLEEFSFKEVLEVLRSKTVRSSQEIDADSISQFVIDNHS